MRTAITLKSFRRSDTKEQVGTGKRITGARGYIEELARLGLVRLTADIPAAPEVKSLGEFERSSALPAAPASPKKTAKKSKRGGRKKKAAPLS